MIAIAASEGMGFFLLLLLVGMAVQDVVVTLCGHYVHVYVGVAVEDARPDVHICSNPSIVLTNQAAQIQTPKQCHCLTCAGGHTQMYTSA